MSTCQWRGCIQGVTSLLLPLLVYPSGYYILPLAPIISLAPNVTAICLVKSAIDPSYPAQFKLHIVERAQKTGN